jgi:hypothetical protein
MNSLTFSFKSDTIESANHLASLHSTTLFFPTKNNEWQTNDTLVRRTVFENDQLCCSLLVAVDRTDKQIHFVTLPSVLGTRVFGESTGIYLLKTLASILHPSPILAMVPRTTTTSQGLVDKQNTWCNFAPKSSCPE